MPTAATRGEILLYSSSYGVLDTKLRHIMTLWLENAQRSLQVLLTMNCKLKHKRQTIRTQVVLFVDLSPGPIYILNYFEAIRCL